MLKFEGGMLLGVLDLLRTMEALTRLDPFKTHGDETYRAGLDSNVQILIGALELLDAPVSIKKAHYVQHLLSLPTHKHAPVPFVNVLSQSLDELRARVLDELSDRTLYYLQPTEAELLLNGQESFGNAVLNSFPEASTDMSEAVACLVWGRHTACVFHLMRVMEISLYEAGKKLGVTIVGKDGEYREWGAITRQMDGAIEKLPSKDEKRKWSEVRALLDHVRRCWRNATMHPRRTYTHEEALAIFDAVKSYLRYVSTLVSREA